MATDSLYITKRWLGGILTNFKTVKKSISRLNELNNLEVTGEIKKYGKKERIQLAREAQKLENFIGGVKKIGSLPKLIVVLDPVLEHIAVQEASKIGASVIALSNSDANTKNIDYNIPCNTKSKKTC
jgi:small subunit ribosomal protein S2